MFFESKSHQLSLSVLKKISETIDKPSGTTRQKRKKNGLISLLAKVYEILLLHRKVAIKATNANPASKNRYQKPEALDFKNSA